MRMIQRILLLAWLSWATVAFGQGRELPDFTDLAEKQGQAVVNISTTHIVRGNRMLPQFPFDEDDPAFDLFRRFMPRQHPGVPREFENKSLGSGFVISQDGYILTNAHVVDGADEVIVKLNDKRELKAKVIGSDRRTDVALIKIEATGLPAVRLGDPNKLRVGEWVVAIGSPFGFESSVTAGIVSAKGRSLPQENYVPFIQTDVAINPGNSGGPLFNLAGEVVGVNSQIYSQSGGYQGVSFSIPIDVAAKVARQLRDSGAVTRGWLGVVVQEVDRDLAQQFGMDKAEGALVARVLPESPAARAGLREGDVILRYNGEPLPSSSSLPHMVGITDPGEVATLDVVRAGKELKIKIDVGTLRAEATAQPEGEPAEARPETPDTALGMAVRPLTVEERNSAQVVSGGLMVTEVRDGPAARAGVRTGDILVQLAGQEVDTLARFAEVVDRLTPGQTVPVLVQRRSAPLFLALDVPQIEER